MRSYKIPQRISFYSRHSQWVQRISEAAFEFFIEMRFHKTSRYQGIVKATVSGVFEDLKFKISEGSDQN